MKAIHGSKATQVVTSLSILAWLGYTTGNTGWDGRAKQRTLDWLGIGVTVCEDLGLLISKNRFKQLEKAVAELGREDPPPWVRTLAQQAIRVFNEELSQHKCLYIGPSGQELLRTARPFGEAVALAFPSCRYDLSEAAKCLALVRATACVFHLMRALETVVRIVARALGVDVDSLHIATQKTILDTIEKRLSDSYPANAPKQTKTPQWVADREFYSGLTLHLRRAKDAWRDSVAHARSRYTTEEAEAIFGAVGDIMRHAAKRLREM